VELTVQDSSDQGDDRHMFGGERVFYLSDFSAKKRALSMGVGFGWMPTYLVEDELRAGQLREVHYSGGSRYQFNPMLVHRADRPLGRTGQYLVSLLRQYSLSSAKAMRPSAKAVRRTSRPAIKA
jgi:DNA-binding transcriptional LysR family regulator